MQLNANNLCEFGDFRLDATRKILWRDGEIVALPMKAVELLCVLVENRGDVISKDALMEYVWKDSFVEESVLTQNIYLLRKILQTKGGGKNIIKNVPRRGYVFNADVKIADKSEFSSAANGANTIIERHLFEKIQIEEIEDDDAEIKRAALPEIAAPRRRYAESILGALILLAVTIFGAYFYFRNDVRQTAASESPPPLKIKSVSAASAFKILAVLPFQNADENFASGFSNDLSIRLGSRNKFTVAPFALIKEYEKNGAAVRADFILDGNIEATDKLYTANIRLLDAKTNAEILAEKFAFDNLIQLEDAVTNRVFNEIYN